MQQRREPRGGIADSILDRIAGDGKPGDRGAIGIAAIAVAPALGPPALGRLLGHLHTHRRTRCSAAGGESQLGKTLEMGNGQIRIALAGETQGAIAESPEAGFKTEIGAKAIEGKGRAQQFLIGGWYPRPGAIHICQQPPTGVGHADAPDRGFRADHRGQLLLQPRTTDLALQLGQTHRGGQGGQHRHRCALHAPGGGEGRRPGRGCGSQWLGQGRGCKTWDRQGCDQ